MGAFIYYVITEGEVEYQKCLCIIMGVDDEGWPCDKISKSGFLKTEIVFKYDLLFY